MRLLGWILVGITFGLVMLPGVGYSQEDNGKDQGPRPDLPGPVHKRLGELVGTWDVATRFVIGDKEREGKATCEAKMILGGRFLQQDYDSRFQGQPFHVMQLLGYDNARKRSIEIMLDTHGTGLMHNEGTVSADGKVFSNVGESIDQATGKPSKLHTVTTIVDSDNFTLEWFRVDEGGKETKIVTLTHKRRK